MGYTDTKSFAENLIELRRLTKDNPLQQESLNRLEKILKDEMEYLSNSIKIYDRNPAEAIDIVRTGKGKVMMDDIRAVVTEMMRREQVLLEKRLIDDKEVENLFTWSIIIAALITYSGLLIAIILITRNFARIRRAEKELQEKEADFRAAAEDGVDLFFTFRAKRNAGREIESLYLQYINPVAETALGMPSSTAIGKPIEQVLVYNHGTRDEIRNIYINAVKAGKSFESEYCVMTGPNSGRYYQEQVVPLLDGIAVSCRDITERKEMERMKNEFVSTVSHELRTPLTSIRGSLGLVLGDSDSELSGDTKELLTIAYNNCERLVRLINDILDIEKIESGKMGFDLKPTALMPLVRQTMDANKSFADKYGVSLVLDRRDGCVTSDLINVIGDGDRFVQVLTNLLSNAIKFSPSGSSVNVCCKEQNGFIHISVKDSGPGIPEEFRSRIFQKFAQADSSDTRQKGGTGLGLSIVRSMVEQMNGEIGFESETGKGSTFYFTIPLAKNSSNNHPAIVPYSNHRVLVCEDERDISNLLRLILERAGFQVDTAYDANSAYELLKKNNYIALTLDLMLPDKCGINLLRELRATPRFHDLPVIVVSAKAEEGRKLLSGDAIQVVDWMHKPIDVERLVHLVRQLKLNHRPRLLHVEDDRDITEVLRLALNKVADIECAPTLYKARELLQEQIFDLVVLDIGLPDGKGTELLPLLGSEGTHPTPVILFTAAEVSQEISEKVAASLTKSLISEDKLLETIRQIIDAKELPLQKNGE